MNELWPSERYAAERQMTAASSLKTTQDFLALCNTFPGGLPGDFDDVVTWIVKQEGDPVDFEWRIASVVNAANLQAYPESVPLLMAFACAAALCEAPSTRTWGRVTAFAFNSWHVEHWLSEAMAAYAELNSQACHAYVALAREVFLGLDNFSLKSKLDRVNEERSGAWASWNKCLYKLDEIWWGWRDKHGFMYYQEERPLFQVFYKLSPDEFIRTVSGCSNPYLVSDLLFVAGIGAFTPRLSEWKRVLAAAPVAFEDGGRWNGSVLIPLLLVEARSELLQVRQNVRIPNPSPEELAGIRQEITTTADVITAALALREDASAIVSRWTPWLMRNVLAHTAKDIADVTSSGFADDALMDAIGRRLGNSVLPKTSPDDAASWESWCYLCVLSSFAYNQHIPVPGWGAFGNEWRLEPEDWAGRKGRLLREHASLITTLNKETPGIAGNLLAYPIAQSSSPGMEWCRLWNDAITLRDIVEFGDSDATSDEYSSRAEAGRLLVLLLRIGLAIFDQGAARCSSSCSPEAESLVALYKALDSATREMRGIDSTLVHSEWLIVAQHLAVRRVIWEQHSGEERGPGNFRVFKVDDTPTVGNILAGAKCNVIELGATLQSLFLNGPDVPRLSAYLKSASISVPEIVRSIRRLNQIHPRKYPIDERQIQRLEEIE